MTGKIWTILILASLLSTSFTGPEDWGFYGHRKINRMAVFTLPQDMILFYKKNIEYIAEHAVDPDKRRYSLKNEFARHYIDIDHWDTIPFPSVPRHYPDAIMKNGYLQSVIDGDTTVLELKADKVDSFYEDQLKDYRYDSSIEIDNANLRGLTKSLVDKNATVTFENEMVKFGILPYFLEEFYFRLVKAFEQKDTKRILKISADIGHYIGDGHVPLHTTLNYNGEMTDQIGIHAFWESRLPELYSDDSYDFIVGKAEYIDNMKDYIWEMVTESHRLLPEVLSKEAEIKKRFPEDQQFCYDDRLGRTIWVQCPEYCNAYHEALGGMVERRMQDAVLAIGSFWYSAWVEAGQPNLDALVRYEDVTTEENEKLNKQYESGQIYGRKH